MTTARFIREVVGRSALLFDRTCTLADARVRVRCTSPSFPGLPHVSSQCWGPSVDRGADYEFIWLSESELTPDLLQSALVACGFSAPEPGTPRGRLLTHPKDSAARLFQSGPTTLAIGGDAGRLFWTYYVKRLMSEHAWLTGGLHLKASAIELDGRSVLVIGRGSGGKTYLTVMACLAGARFVSNTHVLLRDREVIGVGSTMRLRDDLASVMRGHQAVVGDHFEAGEFLMDPLEHFPHVARSSAPDLIVAADFTNTGRACHRLDASPARVLLEHFSWPISTYAMAEDAWEIAGANPSGFGDYMKSETSQIARLVASTPMVRLDWPVSSPSEAIAGLRAAIDESTAAPLEASKQ